MTLPVRILTRADTEAFRTLRLEALKTCPEAFGTDYDDARRWPLTDYQNRIENSQVFGAWDKAELTGILALDRSSGIKIRHRGWITSVYVQPLWRGKGVATALLQAAVASADRAGLAQLELAVSEACPRAQAFYAREGFEVTGRSPAALRIKGRDLDELTLRLRVNG